MSKTKNDIAWERLFEKYKILENIERDGIFEISASQINEFREARLMTKFDHRKNLPGIFKKYKLSILPITRGSYVLSQFRAYKDFDEKDIEIIKVSFPTHIESIDFENITSEATALNCAYVSGILADFIEDDEILPTVSGRMSSENFDFFIQTYLETSVLVSVSNSQVEIDGGYEGLKTLSLIEAKNSISDDFLIRQLYYPYRLWAKKTSKQVKSLFLTYSNGIFSFYEYEFCDPKNYNSLSLIKHNKYTIEKTDITFQDILEVLEKTIIVKEPIVAFPQADSFERVVNLCELLNESDLTREEITTNYDFDPRQTNYYTDAGRYLGLIQKHRENGQIVFSLTSEGQKLFQMKHRQRQLRLVELIFSHKAFIAAFELYIKRGCMPNRDEIVNIMKNSNLHNINSESTFYRRASSIIGWINWIIGLSKL